MPHCAAPEMVNADQAGCSYCGRQQSRKWLSAPGEPRRWFCAGEKAKHGCRNQARTANATVWDPSASRAVVPASRFPALIISAWQTNDALMMSRALASAHQSGFTLSGALRLAMVGELRSAEEARQAKFVSLLSPELLAALSEDEQPCLVSVMRGGANQWTGNAVLEREFGISEGEQCSTKEIAAMLSSFIHPASVRDGLKAYEDAAFLLAAEQSRRVIHVPTLPTRLLKPGASRYQAYAEFMYMQLIGPNDEHVCVCKWVPMEQAEAEAHLSGIALSLDSVPLLTVDEPPAGPPVNIHRMRPRLAQCSKRCRGDEESTQPSAAPRGWDGASPPDGSSASLPGSPCEVKAAELVWPVQELIDLVET